VVFGTVNPPQTDIVDLRVHLGCTREVSSFECTLENWNEKYSPGGASPISVGVTGGIGIARGAVNPENVPVISLRVEKVEYRSGPYGENWLVVSGRCWGEKLFRRVVTKTYENKKGEEIIKDLLDNYVGLSHVRDSTELVEATDTTYSKLEFENTPVWDILEYVAGSSVQPGTGAVGYDFRVAPDGKFEFFPKNSKWWADEGLVLHLPFDEGSGTVVRDHSNNGNNGTIYGATWVDGKYGKALDFNGVEDYVDIPYSASLDNFNELTISCWVYPHQFHDNTYYRHIIEKGWQNYGAFVLFQHRNLDVFVFEIRDSVGQKSAYEAFTAINTWYHIVCTFKRNDKVTIYVNGKKGTEMPTLDESLTLNSAINIAGSTNDFNGIIDEIRIYNRALSANEIKALYLLGPPPLTKRVEVSEYRKDISRVRNKIYVYGLADKSVPLDKDEWTESLTPADGVWTIGVGEISFDTDHKIKGSGSIKLYVQNNYYGAVLFTLNEGKEVNAERYPLLNFFLWRQQQFSGNVQVDLYDTAGKIASHHCTVAYGKWFQVQTGLGAANIDQWQVESGFNWTAIKKVRITCEFDSTGTATFWVDGLYFGGCRYSAMREDSASQNSYGLRELVEVDEELTDDNACDLRAQALLAHFKDPAEYITLSSAAVDYGEKPILPGDLVYVYLPNENVDSDFRVDSVEYSVNGENQSLELTLELGKVPPRLADYMYGLRATTVTVEKLARTKLGKGGLASKGVSGAGVTPNILVGRVGVVGEAPQMSQLDIVKTMWEWVSGVWTPVTKTFPEAESYLQFKDTVTNNYFNFQQIITSGSLDPLLVTDQGVVLKKDLAVGGFISAQQGKLGLGSGMVWQLDPPAIWLAHSDHKKITFLGDSFPPSPQAGWRAIKPKTNGDLYEYNGSSWVKIKNAGEFTDCGIYFGSSLPSSGQLGELFIRTGDYHLFEWNGSSWVDKGHIDNYSGFFDTLYVLKSNLTDLGHLKCCDGHFANLYPVNAGSGGLGEPARPWGGAVLQELYFWLSGPDVAALKAGKDTYKYIYADHDGGTVGLGTVNKYWKWVDTQQLFVSEINGLLSDSHIVVNPNTGYKFKVQGDVWITGNLQVDGTLPSWNGGTVTQSITIQRFDPWLILDSTGGTAGIKFEDINVYRQTSPSVALEISGNGLIVDGSLQVGNSLSVTGIIGATGQISTSVATGTAPISVSSTTLCSNLNADMLDGHHWSEIGWNGGTVTNNIVIEKATPVLQLKNTSGNPELWFSDGANLCKIYGSLSGGKHLRVDVPLVVEQSLWCSQLAVDGGVWCGDIESHHVKPASNNTYDLGVSDKAWHDIFSSYAHIGELTVTQAMYIDTIYGYTDNDLHIDPYGSRKVQVDGSLHVTGNITTDGSYPSWNGGTVTNDITIQKATPLLTLNATSGEPAVLWKIGSDTGKIYATTSGGSFHLFIDKAVEISGDVQLSNHTLAGDSFIIGNSYADLPSLKIGGTEVITSGRVLQNVSGITYGMTNFANQNLLTTSDAIFNSVKGTYSNGAVKAGDYLTLAWDTTYSYISAHYRNLSISVDTGKHILVNSQLKVANAIQFNNDAILKWVNTSVLELQNAAENSYSGSLNLANIYISNSIQQIGSQGYVSVATSLIPSGTVNLGSSSNKWNYVYCTNLVVDNFSLPSHSHTRSEITDFWSTPFWNNIPDKPSTFTPSAHAYTHIAGGSDEISIYASQVTSGTFELDRIPTIPYSKTNFANQSLLTSSDAIFNSVKATNSGGAVKAGDYLTLAWDSTISYISAHYRHMQLTVDSGKTIYLVGNLNVSGAASFSSSLQVGSTLSVTGNISTTTGNITSGGGYLYIGSRCLFSYGNQLQSDSTFKVNTGSLYIGGRQLYEDGSYLRSGSSFVSDYTLTVGSLSTGTIDLYLNSYNTLSTYSSSLKYKENIEPLEDCSWIYDLQPVLFDWKDAEVQKENGRSMGLIAEDVAKVEPKLVWRNKDGEPEGVHYKWLGIPLLVEMKKLERRVSALERLVNSKLGVNN
jgi:hypothetical protein